MLGLVPRSKLLLSSYSTVAFLPIWRTISSSLQNRRSDGTIHSRHTLCRVYGLEVGHANSQEMRGRDSLAPVFDNLNNYETTMYFNGQSSAQLHDNRASGVSYFLAHHLSHHEGNRSLMIASIRYFDTFV